MSEENDGNFDGEKVWQMSFVMADKLAGLLKPVFEENIEENKDRNEIELKIAHTNSLFLLACFMNLEILEAPLLDEALKASKRAMMKFVLANQQGTVN